VLDDVDRSLGSFLGQRLAEEKVTISFDAPTADWVERRTGPTIDLFLHDVREDLTARTADWDDVRGADGRILGRQPPPRRYLLSYLVSAWADDAVAEHRLLGLILEAVLERESIPPELLEGRLAHQEMPVMLQAAVRDLPTPEAFDIWSSLGTPLRSSLGLLVAAPLVPELSTELAPLAERLDLGIAKEDPETIAPKAGGRRRPSQAAGDGDGGGPVPVGRVVKRWEGIRITEK
jgi:hypothetical protein